MHLEYGTCLKCKKPKGNDMDKSNSWRNQATHYANWMENLNVTNSTYNCQRINTISKTKHIICLSLISDGKPQLRWVVVVRWKTQKNIKVNNVPSNRSHVVY
jgi:hypothetical protein